ncbi:MAG TPA: tripartite tricarboxylate transporter substrate-binding protein [Burkholderiales bacterium]|nr:tripartite tricarboxylate transporter substrate-binding protein [Burkholderiales bacterium]
MRHGNGQSQRSENRPGAAGTVGTDFVAKAPPDGYTLLVTYAGSQAINQSLYPKLPFDSGFASVPSVLQHVNTGRVRAIAVSSAKRIAVA